MSATITWKRDTLQLQPESPPTQSVSCWHQLNNFLQLVPIASEGFQRVEPALPAAIHPMFPCTVTLPPSTCRTPLTFLRRKQMRSMFLSRSL